jgi:hypothetical protein
MKDLAAVINSTAVKLRISVSSTVRAEDGRLTEKEPATAAQRGKADVLFGGNVVKF